MLIIFSYIQNCNNLFQTYSEHSSLFSTIYPKDTLFSPTPNRWHQLLLYIKCCDNSILFYIQNADNQCRSFSEHLQKF